MRRSSRKMIFLCLYILCLALNACAAPTSTTSTPTTVPTMVATARNELIPPTLFYIANNQLYELQLDGTSLLRAALGEQGNIMDAVQGKDSVFVLRGNGLQRVDLGTGMISMVVEFDKEPLWGELVFAANNGVLLYSTALDFACASTGIGTAMGFYQLNEDTHKKVTTKEEVYAKPLGLTADRQGIYSLPLGCDPSFDRFWQISSAEGKITRELPTSDTTTREYGEGYAALSPDAHFLAFHSVYIVGEGLNYRLSVYDLTTMTLNRYELPKPASYTGELLWSPTGENIYFILNPGKPTDESTETYGIWSLDIRSGNFTQVTGLVNRWIHIVSISDDGRWLLLQPELEQSVTYVAVSTGEKVRIALPPEGINRIVR